MALDETKTPMLKSAHSLQDWRRSVAGRVGTVTPETRMDSGDSRISAICLNLRKPLSTPF